MNSFRRRLNQAGGVFLVVFVLLVAWVAYLRVTVAMHPDTKIIAHAGGRVGGQDYTDSTDAFSAAYGRGHRLIEVDFETTSDGVVVCGHDWSRFEDVLSFAAFDTQRRSLPHPPCTMPELLDWFAQHTDATLISDVKTAVVPINQDLSSALGNRLVAQAYSVGDARALQNAGIERIILTLYKGGMTRAIDELAASGIKVEALTLPPFVAAIGLALYAKTKLDVPVLTHTINQCWSIAVFNALGVDAVYTDDLDPGDCPLMPLS